LIKSLPGKSKNQESQEPRKALTRRDLIRFVAATGVTSATSARLVGLSTWASPSGAVDTPARISGVDAWFLRNDPVWVNQLSPPRYEIQFEFNVKKIRMRDGVMLAANIWRPKAEGKFPVIYVHLAYDKSNTVFCVQRAQFFVPRGYVFVAIDCRGRYDSDGVPYFFWHTDWRNGRFEGEDVEDCLNWLGTQPWSSGKVGMTGPSYLGFVQWMVAPLGNPYLATIIPYCSPDDHYDNIFPNGAFQLTNSMHILAVLGGSRTNNFNLESDFFDWKKLVTHLPLRTVDKAMLGKSTQLWQDFMDHPDNDHYWRFSVGDRPRSGEMSAGKYPQVKIPTLSITGWYDQVQQATINGYLGMVAYGPEELRNKHHLIVGPWRHSIGRRTVGDLDFGAQASGECLPEEFRFRDYWLKPVELRWYDFWLKGIENGMMNEAPVHIFVMGDNVWRSERAWPLKRAVNTKYYLRSAGHANTRFGDGRLCTESPGQEPTDAFDYDPENPVPSFGGIEPWQGYGIPNADGPRDQRSMQSRNDVLVYSSEPMLGDSEVTGRILCKLYASSTAADTDFTAKLVDVHPSGYAQILREGIIRARYRSSFKAPELLTPKRVYEYTIDLWSISHVFQKGHKILVEISSSNFPKYDRNPNTGHRFGEDAEMRKATQTIFHDSQFASHIILPLVR
jgi:putative CocE/NonD family hydrolase